MSLNGEFDIRALVEPDRVHRSCYTDQAIFEREMDRIFHKSWIYMGHESQVPNPGDFWTAQVGRQRMIMVRGDDGDIRVLYNRCPHRGSLLCPEQGGNTGKAFRCTYHGWQFHLDGSVRQIPVKKGYEETRLSMDSPEAQMKPAERSDSYRGFVFASLSRDGPDLLSWLGDAKLAFDDICDRAPEGEVEVVPNCFRVIQKSNWKIFLENQLDALHPSITHESTGMAAKAGGTGVRGTNRRKAAHVLRHAVRLLPAAGKMGFVGDRGSSIRSLHAAGLYGPAAA